ncbi:5'-methylthioadenosine/S-adenosylhomocysteine nucleosidase [Neobacillus niacini]|uniref:5'-methylthioadenosine/S-adenosylhomocysteine nucleosidase n=1 Tax=Neobacillus niacini TaxID=86668 RepID=UPI002FFF7A1A
MKNNIFKKLASVATISATLFMLAGCNSSLLNEKKVEGAQRPIIIQGPMPIEAECFAGKLEKVKVEKSGKFVFYKGKLNNYPVIVTKTGKGMENAAAATALAIEKYNPIAIINQGTSGGHNPELNVFDIVLGERTTNIGSLKTTNLDEGQGTDPTTWIPMDLMASEGSGSDDSANKVRYYYGDKDLLAAANAVKDTYTKGKVVEGTIGSADFWNSEVDRIKWIHEIYGTDVEEMEGASVAQISDAYDVAFLGIRILSNNKTNGGTYDPGTAAANQAYVYEVVKEYISMMKNK